MDVNAVQLSMRQYLVPPEMATVIFSTENIIKSPCTPKQPIWHIQSVYADQMLQPIYKWTHQTQSSLDQSPNDKITSESSVPWSNGVRPSQSPTSTLRPSRLDWFFLKSSASIRHKGRNSCSWAATVWIVELLRSPRLLPQPREAKR